MDLGKLVALANDIEPIIGDMEAFASSPEGQAIIAEVETVLGKFIAKVNSTPVAAPVAPAAPVEVAPSTSPPLEPLAPAPAAEGGLPATPSL